MYLSNGISLTSPTGGLGPEQIVNSDFSGTLATGDDYGEWEDDVVGAGSMSISGNVLSITDAPGGGVDYQVRQKINISDMPDNIRYVFSWSLAETVPADTNQYVFLGTAALTYNLYTVTVPAATEAKIFSTIVSPGTSNDLYVHFKVSGNRKVAKYGFVSLKPLL